jgi:NADPH:quinone reductase
MSTMKAVVFTETGPSSVLQVTDVPVPVPKPTQALVKVEYSGINFIDTYLRTGLYPIQLPSITGREGSGVIAALGADVPADYGLKVGMRVGIYDAGTAAEFVAADADKLLPLPEGVSSRDGCAVFLQGLTAWTLMRDAHDVRAGETVLVQAGAGGTGGLLVQMGKALGATVIATAGSPAKADIARAHGADHVILYADPAVDVVAEVMRLTGGQGCHAVFSGVGQATFEADLACVRRRGTMVTFGNSSGPIEGFRPLVLGGKNIRLLRPRLDGYVATREEFLGRSTELLDLVAQGKVKVRIGGEYSLADTAKAQDDLVERRSTGKLLIKVQ